MPRTKTIQPEPSGTFTMKDGTVVEIRNHETREALYRLEMERQQQAYITKWRYEADFSYWLKMATWTSDEGAALIHGLEPRRIKIPYPDSTRELFPIIKSWLECREHAVCALRAGQLKESSKPVEFLRWAESLGYPIHEGLQRLFGESQAKTKPAIKVTRPVSAITLKKPKRTNVLSPLITQAIEECGGSTDWAPVWNMLTGSTPILRTLQRSLIMGKRSVYVEEKKVQPGVQTRCG